MRSSTELEREDPTTLPWYRRLGRGIAVSSLLAYLGFLFVGAIPSQMYSSKWMREAGKSVRAAYWKVHVQPGAPVFDGHAKVNWVVHRWCLIAFAEDAEGETELVYSTTPNCELPKVRLVTDVEALALYVTLGRRTSSRLVTQKKHFSNVRRIRRSRGVRTVSSYFCDRSPEGTEGIILVAYTEGVRYKTGKHRSTFDVIGSRRCEEDGGVGGPRRIKHIARWSDEGQPTLKPATPGEIRRREKKLKRKRGWR